MAPGKRKSPFIGAVDTATDPVLYKRYIDPSDILLVPEKSEERGGDGEEGRDGSIEDKPLEEMTKLELLQLIKDGKLNGVGKKRQKVVKGKQPDSAEQNRLPEPNERSQQTGLNDSLEGEQDREGSTAKKDTKKKKSKKEKKPVAKAPSGPSNAAEAEKIRDIMGIKKGKAEPPKQAAGFSFGFQAGAETNGEADESGEQEEAEASEDDADPMPAHNGHPKDSAISVDVPESDGNSHLDAKLRKVLGQKSDHVARRIFVGGMPFSYDEEEVRDYWSYCGEIENLDLMRFPDTGRFKGIAFITFADEAGYKEALKCNGELIDEHKLKVEPCISSGPKANGKPKREDRASQSRHHSSPAPKTPGYHVVYVGNLSFEVTPGQLRETFEGCEITVVRLHTDKDTGKSKGYAHVHFADEESLDRAVDFNGTRLKGRAIKVGYAQPKKD